MSEAMPRPSQYKPLKDIRTLDEAVDHPEVILRFDNALGKAFDAKQYLATIRNLTRENELFKLADPWEIIRCALDLAELGLRPNTPFGHAWIIPRVAKRGTPQEKVTLDAQIGYQGMLELAYRADTLESIHADVVYEGDIFECEYGSNAHLRHVPRGPRRGRTPKQAYCHAQLKGGGQAFIAWDYQDVLEIRDTSEGYKYALQVKSQKPYVWDTCVWVKFEYSMSRKTIMKQLLKELPKSSERLTHAAYIDGLAEAGKLNYGGRPGDLSIGQRELTHQPGATLHDLNFKAPVVDGQAETVAASTSQQGQRAASTTNAKATGGAKPATGGRAAPAHQEGPPPGHPAYSGPEDEPAAGPKVVLHRLISADGEILIDKIPILEWVKEFVDHLKDVPADMLKAFEEHNWDSILSAIDNPETRDMMREAGWSDPDDELDNGDQLAADAENNPQPGPSIPSPAEMLVSVPEGRVNEAEITMLFRNALAAVETPEWMKAWQNANQDMLNGLTTRIKLLAYKEIGARKKALGIEV